MTHRFSSLSGWLPYKLTSIENNDVCQWIFVGNKEFSEPFFDETLLKCLSLDQNSRGLKSVSDFSVLNQWAKCIDFVEPSAFIFHISRCGSTMISQLLGSNKDNIVLSEVPIFDDILRRPYKKNDLLDLDTYALQSVVPFYSQRRTGSEKNVFIKTDCWHLFFYQKLRRLYPRIPFVLIYRSPVEVLNSLRKKPGIQSVPGLIEPEILGLMKEELSTIDFYNYAVFIVEKLLLETIHIAENDHNFLLVNYAEGMPEIAKKIYNVVGEKITEESWAKIIERSLYHSKHPEERFKEMASNENGVYNLATASDLYNQLEEFRLKGEQTKQMQ